MKLKIEPFFCESSDPFATCEWTKRHSQIKDKKGDIEAPSFWSDNAAQIVAGHYFYGGESDEVKENSIRQLIHRVARSIADWGFEDGYFEDKIERDAFYCELAWLCLHQYGSFNSPVWFNCGLNYVYGIRDESSRHFYIWNPKKSRAVIAKDALKNPQISACFIISVADSMDGIMEAAHAEAMLYKYGSGVGINYSSLRSSHERVSGGGLASGPLSFMRISDQIGAVVRSGGKTRRAAAMKLLNVDHPDIMDFIKAKQVEEKKAHALIREGYSSGMVGEAYKTVMFQNSNFSVRVTDDFMQAYKDDGEWETRLVKTGKPFEKHKARAILKRMAEACHCCGDPGIQFHDIFNKWNTCKSSGDIHATNPCVEFAFLNDSACNLASLNLMRFLKNENGEFSFDVERFQKAVTIFVIAQDILVDRASYPTKKIVVNSHKYRPLGLGYTNLGATLMTLGLPYDSDVGREFAAGISSLMSARAYCVSAHLALKELGSFGGYESNVKSFRKVMRLHKSHNEECTTKKGKFAYLFQEADKLWQYVVTAKAFRNAQVTLLAPTGTISFMMDCDTTGIEPDFSLVKTKRLIEGGSIQIVNQSVEPALHNLGYSEEDASEIIKHLLETGTLVGAPKMKKKHLSVFSCAEGDNAIDCWGHIKMLAAVQPFLSGSISKTVNCSESTTADEIEKMFFEAWKMGLKSVSIFRNGSKISPLTAKGKEHGISVLRHAPKRYKLPDTCKSVRHKFEIGGHDGYFNIGLYDDGEPGELFIKMSKQGSTISGLMDAFAIAVSMGLQYGIPLKDFIDKFSFMRFEPSGYTKFPELGFARSPVDYIFRWVAHEFLKEDKEADFHNTDLSGEDVEKKQELEKVGDELVCPICGHYPLRRTGLCHTCPECGFNNGCG